MRILHVLEPTTAGVPRYVSRLGEGQRKLGHEVDFLAPPGCEYLDPDAAHWALRRGAPKSYAHAAKQLRSTVRDTQPDVVHLHSSLAGVVGRLPNLIPRETAIVYQPHAWAFNMDHRTIARMALTMERVAGRRKSMLVCNCEDELHRGRRLGISTPGRVIGAPVDTNFMRPPSPAERLSARERRRDPEKKAALVLGRIAPQKGQDLLVAAWEKIGGVPEAQLIIQGAGDPSHLRALSPATFDRSVFIRPATADVRTALWGADVLLIPSRYETVSLVALEAMAVGLPVVAFDFDGAREALGEGANRAGTVVPSSDPVGMLSRAAQIMSDGAASAALGGHGRRRAIECYGVSVVAERSIRAYRAAIAERTKSIL